MGELNFYLSLFTLDLKVLKEESQELNENEDKYLVDKILISQRKKNILAARRLKRLTHEKELRRQELEVFSCQHCGKSCTLKGNIKKHIQIHTGDKPYACQQCGKSFTQSQRLKIHMRIHSSENIFTCNSVERISLKKETLKNT